MAGKALAKPVVGTAAALQGQRFWLVGGKGGVFGFGSAAFLGSLPSLGIHPSAPIVGMWPTPTAGGTPHWAARPPHDWLVGSDGGVFAIGEAGFFGSASYFALAAPLVGMVGTPGGGGHWLVGRDGASSPMGTLLAWARPRSEPRCPDHGGYGRTAKGRPGDRWRRAPPRRSRPRAHRSGRTGPGEVAPRQRCERVGARGLNRARRAQPMFLRAATQWKRPWISASLRRGRRASRVVQGTPTGARFGRRGKFRGAGGCTSEAACVAGCQGARR